MKEIENLNPPSWYYYNDYENSGYSMIIIPGNTSGSNNKPDFMYVEKFLDGKYYNTAVLAGEVRSGFAYPYIGMGVDLIKSKKNADFLEQIKTGTGLRFKCMGDGKKYRLRIETSDITDFDYYGIYIYPGGTTTDVILNFTNGSFKQEGWGTARAFSKDKIKGISIQTYENDYSKPFDVNIIVWDVSIIK